jgi:hypothetical protein
MSWRVVAFDSQPISTRRSRKKPRRLQRCQRLWLKPPITRIGSNGGTVRTAHLCQRVSKASAQAVKFRQATQSVAPACSFKAGASPSASAQRGVGTMKSNEDTDEHEQIHHGLVAITWLLAQQMQRRNLDEDGAAAVGVRIRSMQGSMIQRRCRPSRERSSQWRE